MSEAKKRKPKKKPANLAWLLCLARGLETFNNARQLAEKREKTHPIKAAMTEAERLAIEGLIEGIEEMSGVKV